MCVSPIVWGCVVSSSHPQSSSKKNQHNTSLRDTKVTWCAYICSSAISKRKHTAKKELNGTFCDLIKDSHWDCWFDCKFVTLINETSAKSRVVHQMSPCISVSLNFRLLSRRFERERSRLMTTTPADHHNHSSETYQTCGMDGR